MVGKALDKPYFKDLGQFGIAWTHECLENGEAFSRRVLSSVDLNGGNTSVVVAVQQHQTAIASKKPLSQGSINRTAIDTNLQSPMVVDRLKKLEAKYGPLVILVEDNLRYPSDPIQRHQRHTRYEFKNRYLYRQQILEPVNAQTLDILAQSSFYPLNAFLTPQQVVPDSKQLSDSDAEKIAANVIAIINAAYDGESYTIWVKK